MAVTTIAHTSPQGERDQIVIDDALVICCRTRDHQGWLFWGGGTFHAVRLLDGHTVDTSFGAPWAFALSAPPAPPARSAPWPTTAS